jgi:hypothetical protein
MAEAPLTHGAAFSSGESHAGKRNRQTQSPLQCAAAVGTPLYMLRSVWTSAMLFTLAQLLMHADPSRLVLILRNRAREIFAYKDART